MSFRKTIIVMIFLVILINCSAQTSPKKAFLKSLLVPGWGELSNNSKSGYVLALSEIVLLSSYFYTNKNAELFKEEGYQYAIKYAGINSGSYDEQYWVNLVKYSSSGFEPGGYNSFVYQEALSRYPTDATMQNQYIEINKIDESMGWDWNSKECRAHFSHIRLDQRNAEDIAKTLVGVVSLNHFVSAINAARVAIKAKKIDLSFQLNSNLKPSLSYTYHF